MLKFYTNIAPIKPEMVKSLDSRGSLIELGVSIFDIIVRHCENVAKILITYGTYTYVMVLLKQGVSHLALVWLDVGMNNHVSLEGLLLHKALVAQVALVGPHVSVDQHVPLHVGQQCELPATDATLVLLHAL